MNDMQELRHRVERLELKVSQTERIATEAQDDAKAARTMASMNGHEVGDTTAKLTAHTSCLNALRETQLEHGAKLDKHERTLRGIAETAGVLLKGQEELNGRVAGLEKGQEELNRRVAGLEKGQEELNRRVAGLEEGQSQLVGRMDKLEGRLGKLEGRLGNLEGRLGNLEGRMDKLETQVLAGQAAILDHLTRLSQDVSQLVPAPREA
jgi:chromosome segregation ATPase